MYRSSATTAATGMPTYLTLVVARGSIATGAAIADRSGNGVTPWRSAAIHTAITPGRARASAVSIDTIPAWA